MSARRSIRRRCSALDTSWHNDRPAGLPQRVLTMELVYQEAGIGVTINPDHSVIDDSAQFNSWTAAELHDAMENYFQRLRRQVAELADVGSDGGNLQRPGVGGVMFDTTTQFGGAGKAPERQGFAVFRKHQWFNDLVTGAPQNQNWAAAIRKFLYTWGHEAGHAFNFLHAWDKGRPDLLSWMNYDWRYGQRNGGGEEIFWGNSRSASTTTN